MSLPGKFLAKLQHSLRPRNRRPHAPRSKGLLLMYHRVAEPPHDPWALSVCGANFAQQLALLRQRMQPLSLHEFLQHRQAGNLPPGAVALTFDDGYSDNLTSAFPLLQQFGIPATIFVATGYLGGERLFWWDELARILLQTPYLPRTLTLFIAGRPHTWQLSDDSYYPVAAQACHASWFYEQPPPTVRHTIYLQLWQQLAATTEAERQRILSSLRAWASLQPAVHSDQHPLARNELQRLHRSPLISIGAHTVTHSSLASLQLSLQQWEINQSKKDLQELLDAPIEFFAYPHGDFDHQTTELVRAAGFTAACGVKPGLAGKDDDPFQLPRLQVLDWTAAQLDRELGRWF